MASIAGGIADKLGNEFERLWTVRQLIDVMSGRALAVEIECLGDDERGTEFWVKRPDGTREAHQCKRENASKGTWSIADLDAKRIFSDAKSQLDRDPSHRYVFVSSDAAPSMRDLCERANRGDTPSDFVQHATNTSRNLSSDFQRLCNRLELNPDNAEDQRYIQDFLRRFETKQIDKSQLRSDVETLAGARVSGDPATVVSELESRISRNENMGKYVDETGIISWLPPNHTLRDLGRDKTIPTKVRELVARFERSYRDLLLNGKELGRTESAKLENRILDETGPQLLLVHGPGGCGKTGVAFETIRRLAAQGIPCLPLRLDRQKPAETPTLYGEQLGLPASPVACLSAISGNRTGVLVLDQLDAIRWTSVHSSYAWDTCELLISEAAKSPNLRVIVVCRTFDAEDDNRIKAWRKRAANYLEEIKVAWLDDTLLSHILNDTPIKFEKMSKEQQEILRSPQSLFLWLQLAAKQRQPEKLTTTADLMDAYWRELRRALPAEISRGDFENFLKNILEEMNSIGSPTVAKAAANQWPRESQYLVSANALTEDGGRLTFSHQSHLDYLTADWLSREISAGRMSITDWLAKNEQSLFRRGQLRQLLILLRDRNKNQYINTMHDLITSPKIRFHLQQLALQILGSVELPTSGEIDLMVNLLANNDFTTHVINSSVVGRKHWFDVLHSHGILRRWLLDADQQINFRTLMIAQSVLADRESEVSSLFLKRGGKRTENLLSVLLRANPATLGPRLFRAYRALLRKGRLSGYLGEWETLSKEAPDRTILLFHAQASRSLGLISTFNEDGDQKRSPDRERLDPRESTAVIEAAKMTPGIAWDMLLPLLLRISGEKRCWSARPGRSWGFVPLELRDIVGRFQKTIGRALCAAGRKLAETQPEVLINRIEALAVARSRALRRVISRSMCALGDDYANFALAWLIADPKRLSCGSPNRQTQREATAYKPAFELLQRFGKPATDESFSAVESKILSYVPKYEIDDFRYCHKELMSSESKWMPERALFTAQYVLLSALPPDRLSTPARSQLGVLTRKFGDVKSILQVRNRSTGGFVGSTIPDEKLGLISDRQWLKTVTRDWSPRQHRWKQMAPGRVGEVSVRTLASDLGRMAHRQPERIARLCLRFPTQIDPAYLAALLRNFAETSPPANATPQWQPAPPNLIEDIVEKFQPLMSEQEVAKAFTWIVLKRYKEQWKNPTHQLLSHLAVSDQDPAIDAYPSYRPQGEKSIPDKEGTAINSVRGTAAEAIRALLFADRSTYDKFRPAIATLVQDPHVSVRMAASGIAIPILNISRPAAIDVFVDAVSHPDEDILGSHHVDEFISYTLIDAQALLRPVVTRMMNSGIESVSERGANWAAEAWSHRGLWEDLFRSARGGATAKRKGIIRSVIRAILDRRGGEEMFNILFSAFNDAEKAVRSEAASIFRWDEFFSSYAAPKITDAFADSNALEENIDDFIFGIHEQTISLRPFAAALRKIIERLTLAWQNNTPGGVRFTDTSILATVLLRLYEQSDGDTRCRKVCLDGWDMLLRGMGWGVLEKLDR